MCSACTKVTGEGWRLTEFLCKLSVMFKKNPCRHGGKKKVQVLSGHLREEVVPGLGLTCYRLKLNFEVELCRFVTAQADNLVNQVCFCLLLCAVLTFLFF